MKVEPPLAAPLSVLTASPAASRASVFAHPGRVMLVVDPGQASKTEYVIEAAATQPGLGLGSVAFIARESSPEAILHAANQRLGGLQHESGTNAGFTVNVIDARGMDEEGLVHGLASLQQGNRPYSGIFAPLDRLVEPTARMSSELVARGALERPSFNVPALHTIIDKGGIRRLCDEIDPRGQNLAHPPWAELELHELTPEILRRRFAGARHVFLLPQRGACKRGVTPIDLEDARLREKLTTAQWELRDWNRDLRSGVCADHVIAVARVYGSEWSVEAAKQGNEVHVLQIHLKADQGTTENLDGDVERVLMSMGTRSGGVMDDPNAALLEKTTVWLLKALAEQGYDIGDGTFHIEFRIDQHTGLPYLIEINPRPGGSAIPKMIELSNLGAANIYGAALSIALGLPVQFPAHGYRPVADVTYFLADTSADARAAKFVFEGFAIFDPSLRLHQPTQGMTEQEIVRRLQEQLARATYNDAEHALQEALNLGYGTAVADTLRTAFRRGQRVPWRGLQAELLYFHSYLEPGAIFHGSASSYLGGSVALGNSQLDHPLAQAHLVAAMRLMRDRMTPQARRVDAVSTYGKPRSVQRV